MHTYIIWSITHRHVKSSQDKTTAKQAEKTRCQHLFSLSLSKHPFFPIILVITVVVIRTCFYLSTQDIILHHRNAIIGKAWGNKMIWLDVHKTFFWFIRMSPYRYEISSFFLLGSWFLVLFFIRHAMLLSIHPICARCVYYWRHLCNNVSCDDLMYVDQITNGEQLNPTV